MKQFLLGWFAMVLSASLLAGENLVHSLLARVAILAPKRVEKTFHQLKFSIDSSSTSCVQLGDKLECSIAMGGGAPARAKMTFEKTTVTSAAAGRLVSWSRRHQWEKEHPNLTPIVQQTVKVGDLSATKLEATYFHLNNIQSSVLLRALDVVTNKVTVISVTTICDANDCSLVSETINSIENSFKKAGK